jgi:hypothetical protein
MKELMKRWMNAFKFNGRFSLRLAHFTPPVPPALSYAWAAPRLALVAAVHFGAGGRASGRGARTGRDAANGGRLLFAARRLALLGHHHRTPLTIRCILLTLSSDVAEIMVGRSPPSATVISRPPTPLRWGSPLWWSFWASWSLVCSSESCLRCF